jgi:hypothetical protein
MSLRNICDIVKKITSIWSQGVTPVHTTRCGVAPFAMIGGVALLEFLNSLNLEILNQGNDATYILQCQKARGD